LVVKNKAAFPITLDKVTGQGPSFVVLEPATFENIVLAPLQERALPVLVKAKDAVPSGKYLLVFEAQAAWKERGLKHPACTPARHEFDAGVRGESELQSLLTAAGVPTFLLAPGFLMVVMFVVLWNFGLPAADRIALDLKKPEFWSISILLSMLTAVAYP